MELKRRTFMTAAALSVPLFSIGGRAHADTVLKWGDSRPPSHPGNIFALEAIEAIREESGGRIDVQHYPAQQLGNDQSMLSQLRSGALELYTTTAPFMMSLVPTIGISGVGFAFQDYDRVWGAMDGSLGQVIRDAARPTGIKVFETFWDNGYRQLSSNRPILTPDDLQGFKIRVAGVPLFFSMFENLGAAPLTLGFGEVYTALQTGLVDGQENPLVLFWSGNFHEVQRHISMTNHVWDGLIVTANEAIFNAMSEEDQDIVSRHINAAGLRQRDNVAQENEELRRTIAESGVTVHDVDVSVFQDALKATTYYSEWRTTMGDAAWQALEEHSGPLS